MLATIGYQTTLVYIYIYVYSLSDIENPQFINKLYIYKYIYMCVCVCVCVCVCGKLGTYLSPHPSTKV